jgi:hypothetical protein
MLTQFRAVWSGTIFPRQVKNVREYLPCIRKTGSLLDDSIAGEKGQAARVTYNDEIAVVKPLADGELRNDESPASEGQQHALARSASRMDPLPKRAEYGTGLFLIIDACVASNDVVQKLITELLNEVIGARPGVCDYRRLLTQAID